MTIASSINCNGLSTALTVLRIKQGLVGLKPQALPLRVSVGKKCNKKLLMDSLGAHASAVDLI